MKLRPAVMMINVALLLSCTARGQATPPNITSRSIPDDNLSYPVMITFKDGASQGSGFFISNDKGVYLVTAKHVIFAQPPPQVPNRPPIPAQPYGTQFELLSYSKDITDPQPTRLSIDLTKLTADNFRPHPKADVVVVKIASFTAVPAGPNPGSTIALVPGVTAIQMAKAGIVGATMNTIKTFDKVLVGNDALILGYPGSIGLQDSPQIDPNRPLLRKGIIAGENLQSHSIVLDCPSYQGNSGGPVLQIEHDGFQTMVSVIGVVVQYVPFGDIATHPKLGYSTMTLENSGYSIAESMDPVLELVK